MMSVDISRRPQVGDMIRVLSYDSFTEGVAFDDVGILLATGYLSLQLLDVGAAIYCSIKMIVIASMSLAG